MVEKKLLKKSNGNGRFFSVSMGNTPGSVGGVVWLQR